MLHIILQVEKSNKRIIAFIPNTDIIEPLFKSMKRKDFITFLKLDSMSKIQRCHSVPAYILGFYTQKGLSNVLELNITVLALGILTG